MLIPRPLRFSDYFLESISNPVLFALRSILATNQNPCDSPLAIINTGTEYTGGFEFGAVPTATDRSRQHQSRSTWGLVYGPIGPISCLVSRL
jgi:hypothetical protein